MKTIKRSWATSSIAARFRSAVEGLGVGSVDLDASSVLPQPSDHGI